MFLIVLAAIFIAFVVLYAFALNWEINSAEQYEAKKDARREEMWAARNN
jgi:nitrogen fixation-related uncharacterized protein